MSTTGTVHTFPSSGIGSIPEHHMKDALDRHRQIFQVGRAITAEMDLENLFQVIMDQTVRMAVVERCSVFLYDESASQLWSLAATELKRNEVPVFRGHRRGRVGVPYREPLLIPDAYADARFNADIDRQTGFRTRSIVCVPLINRHDTCIGTLEALNKQGGRFNDEDLDLLTAISHYVAIALENAKLYETLKKLNASRKAIIDHLGRELQGPLTAVVETSGILVDALADARQTDLTPVVDKCRQNLRRLLELGSKVDGYLDREPEEGRSGALHFIEETPSLFEPIQAMSGKFATE